MSRALGASAIREALPEAAVVLAAFLTQFGDVWFVFVLLGVLYAFGGSLPGPLALDRARAAFAVAVTLGGLAVTTSLKEWLRLPRPSGAGEAAGIGLVPALLHPLYVPIATADGFGFPSGHAVSVVVVYGGLALLVGSRRGYVLAGLLVPLVALSRIVLGVHYLVDVLVGLAVGGGYLAAVYLLCGRGSNPGRALSIALLVALAGAATSYALETMVALGATLSARIAWGSLGDAVLAERATRRGGAAATAVLVPLGILFAVVEVLEPEPHVAFLGTALVVGGVLAVPLLGEAVASRL